MTKQTSKLTNANHTMVGDTLRHAGHKVEQLSARAGDKSDDLIHQGQKVATNLQTEAEKYGDSLIQYIKANPLKSTLIAGGIGLLLGHFRNNKR